MSRGEPDAILVHRVIARLNVGGPAMHVALLARGMDDGRPFRTRLVAGRITPDEGDMAYLARERGVEVTYVDALDRKLRPLRDLAALWALYRLFRRERPTLVHTHTAKAGALGRLAAWLARVPLRVHSFHGHVLGGDYFSPASTRFFRLLEKGLARITHRVVALSPGQARELTEELGIAPRAKVAVIPLGLDLEPFAQALEMGRGGGPPSDRRHPGAGVREELGIASEERVVGMVGRMVPVKNHELFFDALAELVRELAPTPVRALVVGGGEREDALRRYVRERGLEERVAWLGWRRDLPRLYPAMDALALTSFDEGTPLAVIEALAAGVPVVARAVGGVPDVLQGGRWGRLVEEPRPGAVAAALAETLRDPPSRDHLRAASRYALERYETRRLVADMEALYEELLAERGAASTIRE